MNLQCTNPHCREIVRVPPGHTGGTIECPKCGRLIPVAEIDDDTVVDIDPKQIDSPRAKTRAPKPASSGEGVKIECSNPACRKLFTVPLDYTRDEIKCPDCGRRTPIPTPDDRTRTDSSHGESDPLAGEFLGHFQILEKLGEGGMAAVYRARNTRLNKVVALKVLPEAITRRDPKFVERFQREARAAAQIDHPNVVPVHFVGEDQGHHFLEMAFIKGRSLGQIFKSGERVDLAEVVRIISEAARGLAAAHKRGVIHRDVKPDNIMIDSEGRVMISDFGLAKAPTDETEITGVGHLVGTPFYMSPEQCMGQEADTRSDIYALGVTFFEGVTGKRPFSGETLLSVMHQHKNDPVPSPKTVNPRVPDSICRIIAKMTAKDPAQRYQTCDEIIADIEKAKMRSTWRAIGHALRLVASLMIIGASAAGVYFLLNMPEMEDVIEHAKKRLGMIPERKPHEPTARRDAPPTEPTETPPRPAKPPQPIDDVPHPLIAITKLVTAPRLPEPPKAAAPKPTDSPKPEPRPEPPEPKPAPPARPVEPKPEPPPSGRPVEPKPERPSDMVLIPAGDFALGDEALADAKPTRKVFLDAFLIDRHEVTNAEYGEFVKAAKHEPPEYWPDGAPPAEKADHPVTGVSWEDAAAYCRWAGKRLPTEAEWEKACSWDASKRQKRAYPWGNKFEPLRCNGVHRLGCPDEGVQAWMAVWLFGATRKHVCDTGGNTVSVHDGQTEGDATGQGVLGMAGNVAEWCADGYDPTGYGKLSNRNPTGPDSGSGRVVRGGSWFSAKDTMRSTRRWGVDPETTSCMIGFRCAKDAPSAP